MNTLVRIGMDTAKSVFQLHGVDENEVVVVRRQLRQTKMIRFFVDDGEVGERLRKVAIYVLGRHMIFFREQAEVVVDREKSPELRDGLVVAPLQVVAIRHPAGAAQSINLDLALQLYNKGFLSERLTL